jgi:hypothetical protein
MPLVAARLIQGSRRFPESIHAPLPPDRHGGPGAVFSLIYLDFGRIVSFMREKYKGLSESDRR